ncbi:MAG TPA: hypothetical protein VH969_06495 [Actinophytocola sp.]|uniref:hypothetical protein n=1 Tax=Actinophytocola sp. TaxID=1872138 RepID=UPI002F949AAB
MDGALHRDHIRSELGGFFGQGHAEGTVTTGTFAYDEDTLRGLVKDWLAIADHYRESMRDASKMAQVVGAGTDFASAAHANAASHSGKSYLSYLQQNRDYCTQQAQLCQDTLDSYLGVEHTNVSEINKSGPKAGI